MKVYFPLPITGCFIDKIISYSMGQFIYKFVVKKVLLVYLTSCTEMSLKHLTNKNLTS